MNGKVKKQFEKKERKFEVLSNNDMKMIVGSGNENDHSIPPELFEAMFINPSRIK